MSHVQYLKPFIQAIKDDDDDDDDYYYYYYNQSEYRKDSVIITVYSAVLYQTLPLHIKLLVEGYM